MCNGINLRPCFVREKSVVLLNASWVSIEIDLWFWKCSLSSSLLRTDEISPWLFVKYCLITHVKVRLNVRCDSCHVDGGFLWLLVSFKWEFQEGLLISSFLFVLSSDEGSCLPSPWTTLSSFLTWLNAFSQWLSFYSGEIINTLDDISVHSEKRCTMLWWTVRLLLLVNIWLSFQ